MGYPHQPDDPMPDTLENRRRFSHRPHNPESDRPLGSNADEWLMFLSRHLDNRASFPRGLTFVAVQIAEAMDAMTAGNERLRLALAQVAGKNDLSNVPDESVHSALAAALCECEIIAREALAQEATEHMIRMRAPNPAHGSKLIYNDPNPAFMGSKAEAKDGLLESARKWRACRQPMMGTAKQIRDYEAAEREARLRLAHAAALWLWHEENPQTQPPLTTEER